MASMIHFVFRMVSFFLIIVMAMIHIQQVVYREMCGVNAYANYRPTFLVGNIVVNDVVNVFFMCFIFVLMGKCC